MFAFIGALFDIGTVLFVAGLAIILTIEIGNWLLVTAIGMYNALFLGLGANRKRVDEQRAAGAEWNAIRPPEDGVPVPNGLVGRVIVVANFLIQNAIGMAVMAVAFGVAVPQTGAGLRAAQGDLVKAVTVAGLPLGVLGMGLLLAGMLPTSALRGIVVAVLYNAIGFVMSAALLSFMGLLGVPFAVGLIKSLQPVAQ